MHHPLFFILISCTLFHGLIIFAISSTINSPIENIAISCGSSGTAPDGRVWVGDNTKPSSTLLHLNGVSWTSRAQQKASLMIDPVPYQTARTSRHEFSYRFSVKPGQKFIRLHFNPAPYKGFKKSIALFTVKAGPYTLLSNFSPSLTADALGVKFLNKEYCVNVQESEALTIIFTPSQETKSPEDVYAFVNGIEIVSMPTGLYFTPEGDLGAHVVGQKHRFYIDTATALQMIQRLNVGGQSIPSIEDVSMFRDWKDDFNYLLNGVGAASIDTTIPIEYADMLTHAAPPKVYQTARSVHPGNQQLIVHNLTWTIPVNLGFRYLVRLHFCEFEPEISARGERQFSILINNQIAEYNADVIKWSGGNGIAVYKDYIAMMEGDRMKGTGTLVISLQPNSEFSTKRTDGILNGLEIFKLSNPDNYLVGMNPVPQHKQSSVSEMPRRQRPVFFDRKSAIVTAFTVAVTLLNIAIYYLRCLSEANSNMRNTRSRCTDPACHQFSLEEIQLSTSNFSPEFLIGRGGYGNVYKGTIHGSATTVAIKRLKEGSKQGEGEFWTEIKMLSKVRNEHLVSLIGFCNEGIERVLVYEYMPRGTVADHLHKIDRMGNGNPPLSWKRRLKISIGAARGLHFLHTSQHKVIHRDVKSSNILLDESWVAKISDFGLSKMGPGNESFTHVSTDVKGTYGYLDPEYHLTRRLTTKSDVYAFGVVLLEVLTGRPALDKRLVEEGHNLATWAIDYMRKGKVNDIVDSTLAGQVSQICLKVFVEIAGRCLRKQPHERPDMADVLTNLELVLALLQKEGVEDEVMSIESVCSDGVISFDELCGDLLAENMENATTEATPYKGKGKGISIEKVKKDSTSKTKTSIRWWDFLWFHPKQSPRTKTSPTQPRIPKQSSKKKVFSTQLQGLHRFSLQEIKQATDNFNQSFIIGLGEADKVYIGFLNGGKNIVAIRRASTAYSIRCMAHELQSKLDNLPLPNHANVLSLIGYCNPDAEIILVYSYMANGSLQDHLHDPDKAPLPWKQRLKICIDAGHGLCYLQPILKQSILHREFNSTNILLDENWVAKVSDFGWSKNKGNSHVPRAVVGRLGFLDSDYVRDTTSTEKSYAYAFGLLLIEVLCANNELILWDQDRESIASLFKSCIEGSLSRCIDPYLIGKISPDCLRMFVDTASSCLQDQGSKRPSLSEVVTSLKAALELQEAADGNNKGF
ncbi:putative receptor-like protein kinase At5g39000 [Ipomoea triloba]|uniref:putative receptor-like protein kinase At5g39000 n=1 Tax=Ipomoea triloba TaxID=35885 RepID=UPI00125E1612|nr:putative receptor-like protein kinase At5g39000 [Ipomoea triloba]